MPDDIDESHQNDQNQGAGDDDGNSYGHGLLGGFKQYFLGGCREFIFLAGSAGVGPGRIGNVAETISVIDGRLWIGW